MRMKKLILLSIFALIFRPTIFALPAKTDSIPIIKHLVTTSIPADLKLKFLNTLCAKYWNADPDSALRYGWLGLPLLKEKVAPRNAAYLHFALGMAWENKGDFDSSHWYLNRAARLFTEMGEERLYYRSIEQIGSLFRIMGQYDTAIVLMNKALDYFKSTHDNFQIMSSLYNIGSVYIEKNRLIKALEYYQASAAFDSVLKDTSVMATHMFGIGTIYLNLGNLFKQFDKERSRNYFSISQKYYHDCALLFLKSSHKTGFCFTSMSLLSSYIGAGMMDQADSLLNADSTCLSFPDPRISASFRMSKAQMLNLNGKKSEALALLKLVAGSKEEIRILPEFHEAMLFMASLMRESGKSDSAWKLAQVSLAWGRKKSVYPVAYQALNLMSNWFNEEGKYAQALASNREATLYKDSILSDIGKEIFDETELKFKNQVLRTELKNLKAKQELQKFRNLVISLAGIAAILILILVISWLLARQKTINRNRVAVEQKMHILEQERIIRESEMENLHLAMQLKEQELIFHTLKSTDLSQINRSIKEKLGAFQFRLPKKKDQDDFNQALAEIHREAKQDPLADFEQMFLQMHGDFYEKLLAKCPDFTKTELQICALLRLNLSSKDIARLVNLTAASIDVTRSHIRKKLELDQSQSLSSYLILLA